MQHAFEPRVRRVVADILGVDPDALGPDVSLTDDLAADSLDLAELAVRLEDDLGIVLPDRALDDVRTYGELTRATLLRARRRRDVPRDAEPVTLIARLVWRRGEVVRAGTFTPYDVETIAAEALRIGRGARLEVTLPGEADDATVGAARAGFAWLADHGVRVEVGRQHERAAGHPSEAA